MIVHPVEIGGDVGGVVYVVEVPQSHTAHQATDKKYYKRFNFESVPMEDYEIRDVMGRRQQPRLELQLQVVRETIRRYSYTGLSGVHGSEVEKTGLRLDVRVLNAGSTMLQYLEVKVDLPASLSSEWSKHTKNEGGLLEPTGIDTYETRSYKNIRTYPSLGLETSNQRQPPYHFPVLPGMTYVLGSIGLADDSEAINWDESTIRWMAAGDIVPMRQGEILINDLLSAAINESELPS